MCVCCFLEAFPRTASFAVTSCHSTSVITIHHSLKNTFAIIRPHLAFLSLESVIFALFEVHFNHAAQCGGVPVCCRSILRPVCSLEIAFINPCIQFCPLLGGTHCWYFTNGSMCDITRRPPGGIFIVSLLYCLILL